MELPTDSEDEEHEEDEDLASSRRRKEQVQQRDLAQKQEQLGVLLKKLDRSYEAANGGGWGAPR